MSTLKTASLQHPDASSNTIHLSASGNVGIGTDSPSRTLHVNSGTINEVAKFESTDTEVTLEFTDLTGTSKIKSRADFRFETGATPTEAMRIDSSGNVGIGTTSPTSALEVRGGSGVSARITADGTQGNLIMESTTTNYDWTLTNEGNVGRLRFMSNDGTTNRFPMYMYADTGFVTLPYQPSFSAHVNGNYNRAGDDTKINPNWIAIHNTGGGFTSSNSRFTAPIAGKYLLAFYITHTFTGTTSIGDAWTVQPHVNGSIYGGSNLQGYYGDHGIENGTEGSHSWTGVLDLAANDYVELYTGGTTATGITFLTGSTFHMHFLG